MQANPEKKYSIRDAIDFLANNNRQKASMKLAKVMLKKLNKNGEYNSISEVIQMDFNWSDTKDGSAYWIDVRDFLLKLEEGPKEAVAVDDFEKVMQKGSVQYVGTQVGKARNYSPEGWISGSAYFNIPEAPKLAKREPVPDEAFLKEQDGEVI